MVFSQSPSRTASIERSRHAPLRGTCMRRALAVVCASMLPFPGLAMTAKCADSDHVVAALQERFGETHFANVRSDADEILDIYSNPSSRTWTILVTLPDRGLSCLIATGTGDEPLATRLASLQD